MQNAVNLDTVSTTGSFTTRNPLGFPPPPLPPNFPGGIPQPDPTGNNFNNLLKKSPLEIFGKLYWKKKQNRRQLQSLMKEAKTLNAEDRYRVLKAASSLRFCNETMIVKKTANGFEKVNAWNCGKKYCAICAGKKRNKLMRRYLDFFESEKGKELLTEKYDLAMFTVTLQHNTKNLRVDPYYKELSEHWRNGLKYGAFKEYFAGGFYNTEHTYTKNGHHIHRHALVLIPKEFKLREGGYIIDEKGKRTGKTNNSVKIENELRDQWCKRTGGSFQIDLTPFLEEKILKDGSIKKMSLKDNLLEVTKYITKRGKGEIIPYQIIKAVDENCRQKFYNKFGVLYKVKELNLNDINAEQNAEETLECEVPEAIVKQVDELYLVVGLTCKKDLKRSKKAGKEIYSDFTFKEMRRFHEHENMWEEFRTNNSNAKFRWLISQNDRYYNNFFVNEWRDFKLLQEKINKQQAARNVVQLPLDLKIY